MIAPSADDPLEAGDELLFVSAPDQEAALHDLATAEQGCSPDESRPARTTHNAG